MTAEVAILNREAVVIAADSAVTLGSPVGKVYNSANKLFALSRVEPVAVMVYGGGSFEGIPWETVVKEHRRELSSGSFATVEEYAQEFIEYLSTFVRHIPSDWQRKRVFLTAYWELSMIRNAIESAVSKDSLRGEETIKKSLSDRLDSRIRQLEADACGEDWFSEPMAVEQVSAAIDNWDDLVGECWKGLPVTEEVMETARVMVYTSLRVAGWSLWSSGVVVAGFGTAQLFPSLTHYMVDGVLAGQVRTLRLEDVHISWEQPAAICPFGQRDMVQTFMYGLRSDYRRTLEEFTDKTIGLFKRHFGERVKSLLSPQEYEDLMSRMELARSETVEHFQGQLNDLLEKENLQPIMSIVGRLPKEELAEMAEALVNLTSLKRRVTPAAETVGGPVDVAVISKGDGLVWMKRKHYFAAELNPRYFERDRKL